MQPELKLLIQEYEQKIQEGNVPFWEAENFLLLIDYYDDNAQFDKALEALANAIQQHQYSANLYIRKAQILIEQERFELATTMLEKATIFEPSNIDIYLTQSDIYMRLDQYSKALEVLEEAHYLAEKDDLADLFILEATIYEIQSDYKKSLEFLQKALAEDPNNSLALNRIWVAFDMVGNHAGAIKYHLKLIDKNPYSYWAWYNLGLAYNAVGLLEKAAEAFDFSIVINPQFEPAYHDYIINLIALEKFKLALRYLKEYQQFFEPDAEIWYRIGLCYEAQQAYSEARAFFMKALKLNTLNGHVYFHIGNCYTLEDEWSKAKSAYESACQINEKNEEFCLSLADAYDAIADSENAQKYYHKAIQLAPENAMVWVHYMEFLIDEGDYKLAMQTLQEAENHTHDLILDCVKAAILLEAGQRKEGLVLLGQILLEDISMSQKLFQIAPLLEEDAEILQFIADFEEM